jgi:agmatinase
LVDKKFYYCGVPTSEGALGKNKGCEDAPLYFSKLFSISLNSFLLSKNDIELQQKEIFNQAEEVLSLVKSEKVVFFGGTHDITFSTFKAFSKKHTDARLIVFDAHSDCDEGVSTPSHEDFIRALVEQKIVLPENILLFGLRKIYPSEKNFLKNRGVHQIYLKELNDEKKHAEKKLTEFISNSKNLYLSFDVDVIDSKIMKATGYVHKDGLSVAQAKKYFELALKKSSVIDLVEFNPKKATFVENRALKKVFEKLIN